MESLIIPTIVTGIVGWALKALLDMLRSYITDSHAWRAKMDGKVDAINDATQATMRTQILHMSEKYLTRGWLTPEERAALVDMHDKYAALNANGYIDGYMQRIQDLPDKEI